MTDLDARYGRRPPHSPARVRTLAVAGIALLVLVVLAFGWWWWSHQDRFGARIHSYSVESDSLVTATIEVTNHGDGAVRCEILAKDRYTQPVGTSIIEVPQGVRTTQVPTTLTTTGRAVVVTVGSCAAVEASSP